MRAGTHAAVPDARNADIEIYIDGEFYPRAEAKVSVFDSAFLVGDGIWEGIRLHQGRFAFLDRHLDRLFQAAAATRIDIGMTREEVTQALYATVERNRMHTDVHVRLMVSRGLKSTPSQHPSNLVSGPTVVIIAEHKQPDPEVIRRGVSLFTATIRRPPPDTLDQRLNSHSKLHEVIALIQANEAGADEALMLDPTGAVATSNASNFLMASNGESRTSTGHYNPVAITRGVVLEEARAASIPTPDAPFSITDMYSGEEAFVAGP